ncbi:MAG: beta-ketoacyl-ACP synthase III [Anaerolineae bacterium]|jgi:3-oxoacyl-[acyl-carrier-protein] synthase-3
MSPAHIVGWGSYIPERVLTNDDLSRMVDTSDEWILTRTGISERHIAGDGETTSSMATEAAWAALEAAGLSPAQLDLIIVATATPDYAFPATACLVQDALGANNAAAFDLSAGCTGFIYALAVAADMVAAKDGPGKTAAALVIGSETLSRITDWTDRATCVLFGDGAGAVLLRADDTQGGVLSTVLGSDGSGGDLLYLPAGGSAEPSSHRTVSERLHYLKMRGREVFRFAVRAMPHATRRALEEAGLDAADLDLLVPHQANRRILEAAGKALDLSPDRIYSNVDRYGNTSAASIPIALCEAVEAGLIQRDDVVVCVGFGAGLTWGATALRWSVPLPTVRPSFWRRTRYQLLQGYATVRSLVRQLLRWLFSRGVKE